MALRVEALRQDSQDSPRSQIPLVMVRSILMLLKQGMHLRHAGYPVWEGVTGILTHGHFIKHVMVAMNECWCVFACSIICTCASVVLVASYILHFFLDILDAHPGRSITVLRLCPNEVG